MNPIDAFERLFFAVFGQTTYDELMILAPPNKVQYRPEWTKNLFKIAFGIYMLVSVVVLVNLLIAMMSDTYQRIQVISLLCDSSPKEPGGSFRVAVFRGFWTNFNRTTTNQGSSTIQMD